MEAVAEVGAPPRRDIPDGPPFFRFSDDDELIALVAGTPHQDIQIQTVSFTHHLPSADALWDGLLGGTVRTRVLVFGQPDKARRVIRAAFDRLVQEHLTAEGLDIPVSVKVASARRAAS